MKKTNQIKMLLLVILLLAGARNVNAQSTVAYSDYDHDNVGGSEYRTDAHPNGIWQPWEIYAAWLAGEPICGGTCQQPGDCDDWNTSYQGAPCPSGLQTYYQDSDIDGYGSDNSATSLSQPPGWVSNNLDCDDFDPDIHPGAEEVCDGVDNDCDGQVDATNYYADADEDGFGDPGSTPITVACGGSSPGAGYAPNGSDPDDNDSNNHPCVPEVCGNSIDENCDGSLTNGCSNGGNDTDDDYDGYSEDDGDCDDNNTDVNPGAPEFCNGFDDNCDGVVDWPGCGTTDNDNDGYTNADGDCDDNNASIHPGVADMCDEADNDCDGEVDEDEPPIIYYVDDDEDGYGSQTTTLAYCSQPGGAVSNNDDCDDSDFNIHPGVAEYCNGTDDNCDGQIDEGLGPVYCYDNDGDGYGGPSCYVDCGGSGPGPGYVSNGDDPNDNDPFIFPEVCDGVDNDGDGSIDEGLSTTTYYRDMDHDSYGDPGSPADFCSIQPGYVENDEDCDDGNDEVYPDAIEVCDEVDNDCDGLIDEDLQTTYYYDGDGDSYGREPSLLYPAVLACEPPLDYVTNDNDCNDENDAIHPGATEMCNLIDDDCDSYRDEVARRTTVYIDCNTVTLRWRLLTGATNYRVSYKQMGPFPWIPLPPLGTNQVTIPGLTPYVQYRWRVRAQCSTTSSWGDFLPARTFIINLPGCRIGKEKIINSYEISEPLNIFPNPSSQNISFSTDEFEGRVQLRIVNLLGERVINKTIEVADEEMYSIDISALPDGIYQVILSNDSQMSSAKFVKQ